MRSTLLRTSFADCLKFTKVLICIESSSKQNWDAETALYRQIKSAEQTRLQENNGAVDKGECCTDARDKA